MRNLIIYTAFVFAAVLSFTSCENEIIFNGDEKASMMVINGFVSPDSVVKVHISRSKFFLKDDSSFDNITTAKVKLWVNEVLYGDMNHVGEGVYTSDYIPKPGDVIKVVASSNAFENVYGATIIPDPAKIISLDTVAKTVETYYSIYGSYGDVADFDTIGIMRILKFDVTANFHDSAGVQNFYVLRSKIRDTYQDGAVREYYYNISSDDMVFGNANSEAAVIQIDNNRYFEFNDEIIDGKNYSLKFTVNMTSYEDLSGKKDTSLVMVNKPVKKEMVVEITSISKSYYLFLKTTEASSGGTDIFTEPVQIHSNINGGIGIFSGYNISSKSIEIPLNYGTNEYYSRVKKRISR